MIFIVQVKLNVDIGEILKGFSQLFGVGEICCSSLKFEVQFVTDKFLTFKSKVSNPIKPSKHFK